MGAEYCFHRSIQDNQQVGRELADLTNLVHAVQVSRLERKTPCGNVQLLQAISFWRGRPDVLSGRHDQQH